MARVRLITERTADLSDLQKSTFDWVVGSRGSMLRPYEVMLHAPRMAQPMAELGAKVRYESSLTDHDRELVILATAAAHGCAFEWNSHEPLAKAAGVRDDVLAHLAGAAEPTTLTRAEQALIRFVGELCERSAVADETFSAVAALYDESGVVELAATIGYYTMLAYVMSACGAC